MYLRQSNQKRADGSVLSHLQIAENVWDPVKKRSRVRIIHSCGRSDDPKATERLRRLARSILKRCSPEELAAEDPSLRVVDTWPYGDVHVLEHLWREVGLPELIGELLDNRKFEFSIERALFAMVANRACAPLSKLYCHEQLLRSMKFRWQDNNNGHQWWRLDGVHNAPSFHPTLTLAHACRRGTGHGGTENQGVVEGIPCYRPEFNRYIDGG